MKNIITISLLLLSQTLKSQMITHDPQAFILQTQKLAEEEARHFKELALIRESLEAAQRTKATLENMQNFQRKLEEQLQYLGSLKDLKITEIENILQGYFCLNIDIPQLEGGTSYLPDIASFLQGGYCHQDAQRMYEFFQAGTAIGQSPEIQTYRKANAKKLLKHYAQDRLIQQRYYQLSILYENLSRDLIEKAEEFRRQITRDKGELKMNDGERAAALATVQELSLKALELKEKSTQALQKATQPGPAQSFYQQMNHRNLKRQANAQALKKILRL